VKAFHVGGDYHVNTVDRGIPELVRECGHHEVANSLYIGEPRLRVIFCAWAFNQLHPSRRSLDPDHYVTFVSRHLNDSESNFLYGGTGLNYLCAEKVPHSAQVGNYDFHVVTWFALPNSTVAQDWNETRATRGKVGLIVGGFFEFTYDTTEYLANRIRDYRKCGNGRRDPGEMCDYAMLNSSVCSLECEIEQPIEESEGIYECSTDRLQQSYCWLQQCGDGNKTSAEECDDGNVNNGDGCSSQCRIEKPQFTCRNRYNQTSICKSRPSVIATQRQITRSNIVHEKHTESTPLRATIDMPLDSRGLSSAGRLISRTGLILLTAMLATLWTMSTLA
jgi:cysteine-rich repeat protein